MINYSNYFNTTLGTQEIDTFRKEMGKYFLSIHFNGRTIWGNGIVLDFGGRVGEKTTFLKNVVVVEHDSSAIRWMEENNILCSNSENLISDFRSKEIDMIYASHVLEHIPDPLQILHDFYKLLDERGILIIALPADFPTLRPQVKEIDGGGDEHLFCWNFTEIKNLLNEAGFYVKRSHLNAIPYRIGKRFTRLSQYQVWNIFWLLLNTLRWWYNLIRYFVSSKVRLSQAGEILIYAQKTKKQL